MEDFRNMTISLPFPTSRRSLKKFIGMLKPVVCFGDSFLHAKHVSTSSRWEPVLPLGRPLFLPYMMVTSWHPCLVEASRISWPEMISTTTIISPQTLLCSPTNGDNHLPLLDFELSSFLNHYSIGRCRTTNGTIRNPTYSSPSAFWRMENSTVQLETRWTLHLGSVGGENSLFFPLIHVSSTNVTTAL